MSPVDHVADSVGVRPESIELPPTHSIEVMLTEAST